MAEASRAEIQRHLDRLNAFWQAYDQVAESEDAQLKNQLNDAWMKEVQWLAEHAICDMDLPYDPETKTFSLPD